MAIGESRAITFPTPFATVPKVIAGWEFSNGDGSCSVSCHTITVNGFTIRTVGNPAGDVAWLATDAGNP